jgi:hypothetical protein
MGHVSLSLYAALGIANVEDDRWHRVILYFWKGCLSTALSYLHVRIEEGEGLVLVVSRWRVISPFFSNKDEQVGSQAAKGARHLDRSRIMETLKVLGLPVFIMVFAGPIH